MTTGPDELTDERTILLRRIEKKMRFLGTYRRRWHNILGMTTDELKEEDSGLDHSLNVFYRHPYVSTRPDTSLFVYLLRDLALDPKWNSFVNFLKKKIKAIQNPQQRHKLRTLLRHVRTNNLLMNLLKAVVARTYWQADGNYLGFAEDLENLLKRRSLTEIFDRTPMEFSGSEEFDMIVVFQSVGDPESFSFSYDKVYTRDHEFIQHEAKDLIAPTKKVIEIFGSRENYYLCSLREYTALLNKEFSVCLTKE